MYSNNNPPRTHKAIAQVAGGPKWVYGDYHRPNAVVGQKSDLPKYPCFFHSIIDREGARWKIDPVSLCLYSGLDFEAENDEGRPVKVKAYENDVFEIPRFRDVEMIYGAKRAASKGLAALLYYKDVGVWYLHPLILPRVSREEAIRKYLASDHLHEAIFHDSFLTMKVGAYVSSLNIKA